MNAEGPSGLDKFKKKYGDKKGKPENGQAPDPSADKNKSKSNGGSNGLDTLENSSFSNDFKMESDYFQKATNFSKLLRSLEFVPGDFVFSDGIKAEELIVKISEISSLIKGGKIEDLAKYLNADTKESLIENLSKILPTDGKMRETLTGEVERLSERYDEYLVSVKPPEKKVETGEEFFAKNPNIFGGLDDWHNLKKLVALSSVPADYYFGDTKNKNNLHERVRIIDGVFSGLARGKQKEVLDLLKVKDLPELFDNIIEFAPNEGGFRDSIERIIEKNKDLYSGVKTQPEEKKEQQPKQEKPMNKKEQPKQAPANIPENIFSGANNFKEISELFNGVDSKVVFTDADGKKYTKDEVAKIVGRVAQMLAKKDWSGLADYHNFAYDDKKSKEENTRALLDYIHQSFPKEGGLQDGIHKIFIKRYSKDFHYSEDQDAVPSHSESSEKTETKPSIEKPKDDSKNFFKDNPDFFSSVTTKDQLISKIGKIPNSIGFPKGTTVEEINSIFSIADKNGYKQVGKIFGLGEDATFEAVMGEIKKAFIGQADLGQAITNIFESNKKNYFDFYSTKKEGKKAKADKESADDVSKLERIIKLKRLIDGSELTPADEARVKFIEDVNNISGVKAANKILRRIKDGVNGGLVKTADSEVASIMAKYSSTKIESNDLLKIVEDLIPSLKNTESRDDLSVEFIKKTLSKLKSEKLFANYTLLFIEAINNNIFDLKDKEVEDMLVVGMEGCLKAGYVSSFELLKIQAQKIIDGEKGVKVEAKTTEKPEGKTDEAKPAVLEAKSKPAEKASKESTKKPETVPSKRTLDDIYEWMPSYRGRNGEIIPGRVIEKKNYNLAEALADKGFSDFLNEVKQRRNIDFVTAMVRDPISAEYLVKKYEETYIKLNLISKEVTELLKGFAGNKDNKTFLAINKKLREWAVDDTEKIFAMYDKIDRLKKAKTNIAAIYGKISTLTGLKPEDIKGRFTNEDIVNITEALKKQRHAGFWSLKVNWKLNPLYWYRRYKLKRDYGIDIESVSRKQHKQSLALHASHDNFEDKVMEKRYQQENQRIQENFGVADLVSDLVKTDTFGRKGLKRDEPGNGEQVMGSKAHEPGLVNTVLRKTTSLFNTVKYAWLDSIGSIGRGLAKLSRTEDKTFNNTLNRIIGDRNSSVNPDMSSISSIEHGFEKTRNELLAEFFTEKEIKDLMIEESEKGISETFENILRENEADKLLESLLNVIELERKSNNGRYGEVADKIVENLISKIESNKDSSEAIILTKILSSIREKINK